MKLKYPNIFIIGVMRAGTTSLFEYLSQHPEIFKPVEKGPDYFNSDKNIKGEQRLKILYKDWNKEKYALSAAHYFSNFYALKKIKKVVPNAKIIISIRNPEEAMISHYKYHLANGKYNGKKNLSDWKKANENICIEYDYKRNLPPWKENFKDVKIIQFEEWINNPLKVMKEIFLFLNIDENFKPMIKRYNSSEEARKKRKAFFFIKFIPKEIRLKIIKSFPQLTKFYSKAIYKKK